MSTSDSDRERAGGLADPADLTELLEHAPVGLSSVDAVGTIRWANHAEHEPLGYRREDYVGRSLRDFHVDTGVIDELLQRVISGEGVQLLPSAVRCRNGTLRDVVLSASPRFDAQGRFQYARCVTVDVSERRAAERRAQADREALLRDEQRARERLSILARASEQLAASLDYESTLERIASVALPSLGELCVLDVREGERVRRFTRAHDADGAQARLSALQVGEDEEDALLGVWSSGRARFEPRLDGAWLQQLAGGPEQRARIEALGAGSMISVPLTYQGELLGGLTVFHVGAGRQHTEQDVALAEELARRAASALVNARLFKEARDAIGVRDDFLSMAGHELRTPLTALQLQILSITKLINQPGSSDKVAQRADKAGRNVLRLSALVNELLDISRISAGRLRLERSTLDLGALLREVTERHREELERVGCELKLSIQGDLVGSWDRGRVEQIATNLLANGIKYGQGKPIELSARRVDEHVRLVLRDHGIGISPEDQQRVFQRFERAVSARHFGGLGLGLWIARQLVDAHGGTIRVTSEPDMGATFEVELPIAEPGDGQEVAV